MRRWILVGVVALGAASCSGNDKDATTTTVDTRQPNQTVEGITKQGRELDTADDGKLTACVDVPKPPFAVDEGGRIAGIDPELLRGLSGRLGIQAEFRDVEAGKLFAELDDGKCDLVASAVLSTAEAAASRMASEPYFDVTQALLVREEDASKYPELAALRGRAVGVQGGTAGAALVRRDPGVTATELPDIAQLAIALKEKRVDGVVFDYPVLTAVVAAEPGRVVTKRFPDVTDRYVFVMRKDGAALKAALDEALRAIRRDDTYNTAMRRYLGTTATP